MYKKIMLIIRIIFLTIGIQAVIKVMDKQLFSKTNLGERKC